MDPVAAYLHGYNGIRQRQVSIDASTRSLKNISEPHAELHGGNVFHAYRSDTLATGDNIWIALTTPNTDKEAHIVWSLYCAGAIVLTITRAVSSYTGGTAQTPQNAYQRGTVKSSVCTVKVGSDGALSDGIAVTGGTEFDAVGVGSGNKGSNVAGSRDEFIPAKNSITIYDILAVGNNIVCDLHIDWYEHTPKEN